MPYRLSPAATGALACTLALIQGAPVWAADPAAFLESSAIVGAGDTLVMSRVPVRSGTGAISYKDVSMQFSVDTAGNLDLDFASVAVAESPALKSGTFKAGIYTISDTGVCPSTGCIVSSPGVPPGGRVMTSISSSGFYFNSASWVSGPVTGHPYETALKKAGITSNAMTWGMVGTGSWGCLDTGTIIGVVQTGNQLTITGFGIDNIPDCSVVLNKKL